MLRFRLTAAFFALFAATLVAAVGSLIDGYHYGQGHLFAQLGGAICFLIAYRWQMRRAISNYLEIMSQLLPGIRARLVRVQKDEVWDEDTPGPYNSAAKAAEINRLSEIIATVDRLFERI